MAVRSAIKGWAAVEKIGLTLPGVETGISWGTPALKLRGQMVACIPTNKQAEKNSIAVRIDFAQRDELLEAEPDVYYVKEHYLNYPCVLARLSRIHPDALRGLLAMGYDYVNARAPRKKARTAIRSSGRKPRR